MTNALIGPEKVGRVCTRTLVTVDVNDSLIDAAQKMSTGRIGGLLVMDKGTLVGVISESDVVCAMVEGASLRATVVSAYMTEDPITVSVDDDVALAARYMFEHGIGHLPVVDSDEPVGILTRTDLLRAGGSALPRSA